MSKGDTIAGLIALLYLTLFLSTIGALVWSFAFLISLLIR